MKKVFLVLLPPFKVHKNIDQFTYMYKTVIHINSLKSKNFKNFKAKFHDLTLVQLLETDPKAE